MAQNTYKQNTARKPKNQDKPSPQTENKVKFNFWNDRRLQLVVGFALIGFSLFAFLAMVSYIFTGEQDQSLLVSSYPSDSKQEGGEIKKLAWNTRCSIILLDGIQHFWVFIHTVNSHNIWLGF